MLSNLWGRITGADKKKTYPVQQASVLGRIGDYVIIYPYGMYCDLPNDVLLNNLGNGRVIPVTVSRPQSARGEIIVFHPVTGAKVHFKNNGDIDVEASGDINATCVNANIAASGDIVASAGTNASVTAPNIALVGNVAITGDLFVNGVNMNENHTHTQGVDSAGNTEQNTGGVVP